MNQVTMFLGSPVGIITTLLTTVGAYFIARLTRSGSKEANKTADWDKFATGLAGRLEKEEAETVRLGVELEKIRKRIGVLEISRYRWKWWAQNVVLSMTERGISLPPTPEPLENTDPRMRPSNDNGSDPNSATAS